MKKMFFVLLSTLLLFSCANPSSDDSYGSNNSSDSSGSGSNSGNGGTTYNVNFNINVPTNAYGVTYNGNGLLRQNAETYINISSISGAVNSSATLPTPSLNYVPNGYDWNCSSNNKKYFDCWNTREDGNGTNYDGGASYTITSNITLYAKYKNVNWSDPTGDYFNCWSMNKTTTLNLVLGQSKLLWLTCDASTFKIINGNEVIHIDSSNNVYADSVGSAVIYAKIYDDARNDTYVVNVNVTAPEGTPTPSSSLVGKWIDSANTQSWIQFNGDGTGSVYYVPKGQTLASHNTTFNYSTYTTVSYGSFIEFSNWGNSSQKFNSNEYSFTVSGTTLKIKGYLAFGSANPSTWTKQ